MEIAKMIELQKGLLEHYMLVEGLPGYPINLMEKSGRLLMRDFTYRLIDELVEASQLLVEAHEAISSNRHNEASSKVVEFNDEIGDIWHYLIEMIIYTNMDTGLMEIVGSSAISILGDAVEVEISPENRLESLFEIVGSIHGSRMGEDSYRRKASFKIPVKGIENLGGNSISFLLIDEWYRICWETTQYFFSAIHTLKFKPWAQTEAKANIVGFYDLFGKGIISLIEGLILVGKTPESLMATFLKVNKKNKERIENGY